jgi:hypothetical protein
MKYERGEAMLLGVEHEVKPREEHIEALFKRYPDVNAEVIVKEDTQREGFMFTNEAINFGGGEVLKTYHLFSWDQGRLDKMDDQKAPIKLPNVIEVHGGPYQLRRTIMRPRINPSSPYLIDVVDGVPRILDRATRKLIADVKPWGKPPLDYFKKQFSDGTPFPHVLEERGDCIVFRQCQYWGPEDECKFCDINENARTKKLLGQVGYITPKKPEEVAEAAFHLFIVEDWTRFPELRRPYQIHLNGGTIEHILRKQSEQEFYLSFVAAVRERTGNKVPIMLQSIPWTEEMEKRAKEAGVTSRSSNFEVWDEDLFEIISPGKARHIGRNEWIRRMLDQVDIFGVGHVIPGFVAGVEMAQPWGFKTVKEAVRSTTEGLRFFMSHGIVVRPISWCVEALSALGGQTPPPVDYFIQIDQNWYDLLVEFDLPPQTRHPIGPGRNHYPNSAAWDMGD